MGAIEDFFHILQMITEVFFEQFEVIAPFLPVIMNPNVANTIALAQSYTRKLRKNFPKNATALPPELQAMMRNTPRYPLPLLSMLSAK